MKITSAEFLKSAVLPEDCPKDGLPEFALFGRSNVGKSSLINTVINRKKLAKTSSTPGKTRTLNFYKVNKSFYMVDLPGYGYARVPRGERRAFQTMVDNYLGRGDTVAAGILILDVRRDPGELEESIYSWFEALDIPVVTVLTKADKFKRGQLAKRVKEITTSLGIEEPVIFSAVTGAGKSLLMSRLAFLMAEHKLRPKKQESVLMEEEVF